VINSPCCHEFATRGPYVGVCADPGYKAEGIELACMCRVNRRYLAVWGGRLIIVPTGMTEAPDDRKAAFNNQQYEYPVGPLLLELDKVGGNSNFRSVLRASNRKSV